MRYATLDDAWGVKQFPDPVYDTSPRPSPQWDDPLGVQNKIPTGYEEGRAGAYRHGSYANPRREPTGPGWTFQQYAGLQAQLADLFRVEGVLGLLKVLPNTCVNALRDMFVHGLADGRAPTRPFWHDLDGKTIACAVIVGFVLFVLWDMLCRGARRPYGGQ